MEGRQSSHIPKKIKDLVKKRDNFICVCCGEEAVLIHHMDFNWFNQDPENLVMLCWTCHNRIHSSENRLVATNLRYFLKKQEI